jgi:hypothetical protein
MGWRVKVSANGQGKTDQAKESRNGMNDKGDRDRVAEGDGKREVSGTIVFSKKTGCGNS